MAYREGPTPKLPTHGNVTLKPKERSKLYQPKAPKPKTGLSPTDREKLIAPHPFKWEQFRRAGIDEEMIRFAENRLINPKVIGSEYVNPHVLVFGSWKPNMLYDNLAVESNEALYTWYQIAEYFDSLIDEAEKVGSKVAFICIPSTVQVSDDHHDFYRRTKFKIGPDLLEKQVPQTLLRNFSEGADVPYVDLLPAFREKAKTQALYFDYDDHLNSKGHELAFEVVRKALLDPYKKGELTTFWQDRTPAQHKVYLDQVLDYQINLIRSSPEWLAAVEAKAIEKGIPLDAALYEDALYVLRTGK